MAHKTVTVGLSREPDLDKAINIGRVGLRERLLTWLFGPMRDVTLRRVDDPACGDAECSDVDHATQVAELLRSSAYLGREDAVLQVDSKHDDEVTQKRLESLDAPD